MSVELSEWAGLLRREYLDGFIEGGGAAVKIAVAPAASTWGVAQAVESQARAGGYAVARVEAARTRVHMVDQIFHAVARQIDWDGVARRRLSLLLWGNGIQADPAQLHDLEAVAQANGRHRRDLLNEVNRLIENAVLRNYGLSREFRTAMAMLCWGIVNPQNVSPTDSEVIVRWLRGEKAPLAALKKVQIYGRVGRHNARLMLASLSRWLRQSGTPGLVLILDLNAVVAPSTLSTPSTPASTSTSSTPSTSGEAEGGGEPSLRYTRGALLDAYEVLRGFIDDTDQAAHFLMVVVAGPGLLDDPKRSVDNYTALKMRIVDEVHDRTRDNPLNAMVRLGASGDHGAAAGALQAGAST